MAQWLEPSRVGRSPASLQHLWLKHERVELPNGRLGISDTILVTPGNHLLKSSWELPSELSCPCRCRVRMQMPQDAVPPCSLLRAVLQISRRF